MSEETTTTLRDLTRGLPEFCEDDCFGLVIATKSLDRTAESVYGVCLSNHKGDILLKRYVGQDVPDSTLGYDRMQRSLIDETGSIADVLAEMFTYLPKQAKLFSSHTDTWAVPLFKSLSEAYPLLPWDTDMTHVDIRGLAKKIEAGYLPNPNTTLADYCAYRLSPRLSLFEVAAKLGIRDQLTIPSPESKASTIGKMINALWGQEIKTPK